METRLLPVVPYGLLTDLSAPEAKVAVALLALLGVAGLLVLRRQVHADRAGLA
jgi:hypothetical protein